MAVALESFLVLEESLSKRLGRAWNAHLNPILTKIAAAVKKGDWAGASRLVDDIDMMPIVHRNRKYMELIGMGAAVYGATRLEPNIKKTVFSGKPEPVDQSVDQMMVMIGRDGTMAARMAAHEALVAEEYRILEASYKSETLVHKAANFVRGLSKVTKKAGKLRVDTGASLHTSRLANWGFTAQADARGTKYYEVNEQLDGRTCPVCRLMNGKAFPVDSAKSKLERQMATSDPAALKSMAPFPKQNKAAVASYRGFSKKQFIGAGMDTPPYHPMCRGVLVPTTQLVDLDRDEKATLARQATKPTPTPPKEKPYATSSDWYATYAEVPTADELLASYDPSFATAVGKMKAKLKGMTPSDVKYKDANGNWLPERAALHRKIIGEYLDDASIARATPLEGELPKYTMFGGRGGSGKSAFTTSEADGGLDIVDKTKTIFLDSDEIKGKLTGYKGWNAFLYHEESSYLFDTITNMSRDLRLNVVHDMTLKSTKATMRRANPFISAGYEVEGYYMFLPPQEAAKRALTRFATDKKDFSGRFVPPEVVLSNTQNEVAFDRMKEHFSKWSFYDNQGPFGSKPLLVGSGIGQDAQAIALSN